MIYGKKELRPPTRLVLLIFMLLATFVSKNLLFFTLCMHMFSYLSGVVVIVIELHSLHFLMKLYVQCTYHMNHSVYKHFQSF